jgi:hypothetical protein
MLSRCSDHSDATFFPNITEAVKFRIKNDESARNFRELKRQYYIDFKNSSLKGVDWICLARSSNWWRALVKTVMNLRLP